MPRPVFNMEKCKGCELCAAACPKKIIAMASDFNSKGYYPAICIDENACIGCALCAINCPDAVIEVYK